ncbi:MAG TPA: hypothetical protein VJ900_01615 [Patescibacteria group bacterium]|nr:hypothetical protein [Patescibacteria group bacterium]
MKTKNLFALVLSALSYVGVLCFLPFFIKVKNEFIKFHAKQGMSVFILEVIFTLVWIIPFIGWIIGALGWLVCILISIFGFIQAIFGERWQIPGLKKFVNKIKF